MSTQSQHPGLCLIAEIRPGADWQARIAAALDATGAVTLVLAAPADGSLDTASAKPLVDLAQKKKVAALLTDDWVAARAMGADGVHLTWRPDIENDYDTARSVLGPDAIVGGDAGASRHDAMTLGEAGADYVAFTHGEHADEKAEALSDLVHWWSKIFVVPVVAFAVETPEDAAELSRAGADFIAVRLPNQASDADAAWASSLLAAVRSGSAIPAEEQTS